MRFHLAPGATIGKLGALWLVACSVLPVGCRPRHTPREPRAPLFSGRTLHRFDFESLEAGSWSTRKLPRPDSLAIVDDPLGPGNHVARFHLHRDDPIVSDGKRDQPEEESKSPALALRARGKELYITNRWDSRRITPANRSPRETLWRGPLDTGVWTEWVVQVRWSFEDSGVLRIWKDGQQIIEKRGPNTYNDERGMYFKIGIYKPPWGEPGYDSDVDERTVYHDDIWIGVGASD